MTNDRRTDGAGTEYFVMGRGMMTAVLQWSRTEGSSPYGLLLWPRGTMRRKEGTLLFHPERGVAGTMLAVRAGEEVWRPEHETTVVRWESTSVDHPIVRIEWRAGSLTVVERFFFRDSAEGVLCREVRIISHAHHPVNNLCHLEATFLPNPDHLTPLPATTDHPGELIAEGLFNLRLTGSPDAECFERFITCERTIGGPEQPTEPFLLTYQLEPGEEARTSSGFQQSAPIPAAAQIELSSNPDPFLEQLAKAFNQSLLGIEGMTRSDGRFDASVWQYGYEWGQDAAMLVTAACYAGAFDLAERLLINVLTRLTNEQGQVMESSRFRGGDLAELNANGAVLLAVRDVVRFTQRNVIATAYWERITAMAELPLRPEHRDQDSGLIGGRRDLWERLPWMGIEEGYDLATNMFVAEGLLAIAEVAELIGKNDAARRWNRIGMEIRDQMYGAADPTFLLNGKLVHRIGPDGRPQRTMSSTSEYHDLRYRPYVPATVTDREPRPAAPDSVNALPFIYTPELFDPQIIEATLDELHGELWNQTGIGGYGRSPVASDPDSPGPWTFVTAWMGEAEVRAGLLERARATTGWLLDMAGEGGSWFEYYGERQTPPFPPTGIIVWGWGQFLLLVVRGWFGIELRNNVLSITPRIAPFVYHLGLGDSTVRISVDRPDGEVLLDGVRQKNTGSINLELPILRDHDVTFQ